MIPALPTFQHDLHTSETGVTWLLTGFLLSASVGTAIIGKLGDMYGKQRLLVWTLLMLAAGTLLAALSGSLAVLIVARVIQGVAGGIFPLAFAIVRDEFPRRPGRREHRADVGHPRRRRRPGAGRRRAHRRAPELALAVLDPAAAIMLAAAFCTWRYIPESPVRAPGPGQLGRGGADDHRHVLLLIAIAQTTTWGWTGPRTLALLAAGLAMCGVWVLVEVRSANPLVDMAMMRVRGVWTTNLAAFLLGAGLYSVFLLLPQFAQLPQSTGFGYGASVVAAGLYLLPCALGMGVLGAWPAGSSGDSAPGRADRRRGDQRRRLRLAGASPAGTRTTC